MASSAHKDSFTADNLPPVELLPDFINLDQLGYPERLNCAVELIDRHLCEGRGEHVAVMAPGGPQGADVSWTYAELAEKVNQIANVLAEDFGLVPGGRVLLRFPNTPMMAAIYFAVLKAGGVVVATMPLLRAKELSAVVDKARIDLAVCDHRLAEEMEKTLLKTDVVKQVIYSGSGKTDALESLMERKSIRFEACDTAADDVCLLGFTSGTTGEPKATMHFHRDMLAICDCYSKNILKPVESDIFTGSPPLAFTFGLGGLVLFPFRVGATSLLLERAGPDELFAALRDYRPTVIFTAPTAYRAMLAKMEAGMQVDFSCLRKCVSAGEALPKATWDAWFEATGVRIMDGIGATEMLHIFIAAPEEDIRPGATGKPVPGYEAKVIGPDGREVADGTAGRLAVRGPTGCRYLADARQSAYVESGWNVTGDSYIRDADGYFWYQARSDDMIVSSGYNIAGPEVEGALMAHEAVAECGVVGAPDPERGRIVKAYVVLKPGFSAGSELTKTLQDYVKAELAPYKYPRSIEFVEQLPRTETGKLQRFALRQIAENCID